jgi:hypothetical protein
MKKLTKSIPLIAIITYIIMVILNALANILPINGRNTGEISDFYADLFAPAGLTFSIWGLIYILILGYSIYQLTYYTTENEANKKLFHKINIPFIISSLANSLWILAWHYDFILGSVVLMIVILVSLIFINLRLRKTKLTLIQNLLIRLPFSVYFGWITVASVANIITLLVSINWNRFGIDEYIWADIIILVAGLIGFIATLYYKNIPYNLVIIWAYTGILIKHLSPTSFNGEYLSIIISVIVSIILFS